MANKLLKTLSLDGVSMDIKNDRFPDTVPSISKSISHGTTVAREKVLDITQQGILIATAQFAFGTNPNGTRIATVEVLRGTTYTALTTEFVAASPFSNTILITPVIYKAAAGEQIYVGARHSITGVTLTTGVAFKYIFIPEVVGGVIQHLKSLANSICYRPLKFGKAVA